MTLGSTAACFFLICTICFVEVDALECNNGSWINGSSFSFPNKVFKNIRIIRKEDPEYRTQLSIQSFPTKEYSSSLCEVILSSDLESCSHFTKKTFNLKDSVSIPNLDESGAYLKPGCNYSLVFIVDGLCTQKFYSIPERRPCEHFSLQDTIDTFPNDILDNVTISAFKKNAIRLNISLLAKPEYSNLNGSIAIGSKVPQCDHREEFSFSLSESTLVIPRAEYPHSFIDTGCEYMIDFELNNGYCVTTNYKVPDLCLGHQPQATVTDVVEAKNGRYKIVWDLNATEANEASLINIGYRIQDVPYEVFNNDMIIENNFTSKYSLLNFSGITRAGTYRLVATFINEKECSNVSTFDFEVRDDPEILMVILASTILLFTVTPAICMCIPSLRSKVVYISKRLFGQRKQVPVSTSVHLKNFISKKTEYNTLYVPLELQNCDKFEFPLKFQKLEFEPDMESKPGNFAEVRRARAYGLNKIKGFTTVAVKMVKDNASEEDVQALKEEISTLRKIASHGNHENVVKMLGCCSIKKPYMILLEFVACGDLKSYLKELRNEWLIRKNNRHFIFPGDASNGSYISPNSRTISETSSSLPSPTDTESTVLYDDTDESLLSPLSTTPNKITPALSNEELQNFAIQIARGMAFLESISLVHRDLAARNVLINERRILKISDFGMSRIGDYVQKNNGPQPLRWMAPESIEKFTCTSKSDVWSFGVVLWEIGTLGAFPYDSISNDCILEYLLYSLKKGIRLMRPEICTDELYSLMLKCWSENPGDRPTFQQIVDYLSGEKKKIYLDFRKLSPAYVFPPNKES